MMTPECEEGGYTLVELLIAMIVATIIISGISAAIVVAAETTGLVSARLSQSDDRQLVEIYLPRDTTSARVAEDATTNGGTQPVANCAKDQGIRTTLVSSRTPAAVLILKGTGETFTTQGGVAKITFDSYEADYVVPTKVPDSTKTKSKGRRLIRYYCYTPYAYTAANPHATHLSCAVTGATCSSEIVSFDLWSKTTRTVQPASATITGTRTYANRTIVTLTLTDTTRNHYSVSGVERS